ncbi:F-box protein [Cardamine amara subsp. amara]|uniref:F-box protein n=1 Tax=Cardamine amara subsp. amara TaxID=228776 RepID=A0ABD0ZJX4_CARAN
MELVLPHDVIEHHILQRLDVKTLLKFIWSFNSYHKTWNQIYSIDLNITSSWFGIRFFALTPLAVLDKDKLLFYDHEHGNSLVTLDPNTKSYDLAYTSKLCANAVCYFPTLISIL